MSLFTPIWNAFNAGELSPLIDGRTDQEKYFTGCKRLRNFIPTPQGAAMRRGGSRYLGATKGGAKAWLLTFEFNQAQSYVLELTDHAMRFWVNRGQLLSGPSPYEIATPWSAAQLVTEEDTLALRTVQSGDVMWICHDDGAVAPHKLSRLGAVNWTLLPVAFDNGPFQDIDPDTAVSVSSSGVTKGAVVTISASTAIFSADDIGTPFYFEQKDGAGIKAWGAHKKSTVGDVRKWEGNYYQATANGGGTDPATGDNPPVHTEGRVWDGDGVSQEPNDDLGVLGAEWEYLHSGYGWVKITAVAGDGLSATATVIRRLPDSMTTGTTRWAKSAFSALRGWPTAVTFFRERLCYARGREMYMSVVGDYDDFSRKDGPDVTKETSLNLKLASDRLDLIRWIIPSAALLVGTARNELSVQEQTTTSVFAADNAITVPQTEYGSRLLEPIRVGGAVLFLQRAGRKVRELIYDYSSDRYKADDLTVLSEHIVDAGIVDMDFQQEPDNIVWCILSDGTMAALTYNRERGVVAWAGHVLGGAGKAEAVASIAGPDGRRDDVWLSVQRTINGMTTRYIEVLEDPRLAEVSTADGFFGDCGITYTGSPTKIITGLGHLEGQHVQVLADGSAHADVTVAAGQITLNRAASTVQIGYDSPAQLQTMRLEGGTQSGSSQTHMKSIAEVWLRVLKTIGGKVGPSWDTLDDIPGLKPTNKVGVRPDLFTGDRKVVMAANMSTDAYVCVQSSAMLPMTLTAIIARAEVND